MGLQAAWEMSLRDPGGGCLIPGRGTKGGECFKWDIEGTQVILEVNREGKASQVRGQCERRQKDLLAHQGQFCCDFQ